MKMSKCRTALLGSLVGCVLLTAAGCGGGGPYRIRDTGNTNNTYYTKSYKKHRNGTISFKDARTEAKVTLQSSVVEEIPRNEWRGAIDE